MEAKNRNSGGHIESTGTEKDIYEDYSYGN